MRLQCLNRPIEGRQEGRRRIHALDGRTVEAHERVPLPLVPDRRALPGDDAVRDELLQARERGVRGVDGLGEREVALRVLVPVVHDCLCGERREVGERGVHLGAGALEEAAAAGDEERVPGEDAARVAPALVCHVVADRVLGVAGCGETPGKKDLDEIQDGGMFEW